MQKLSPLSIPLNESQILGDDGDNFLLGTEGNDVIQAKGGSDAILAGAGNDIVIPTDTVSRGAGENDYIDLGTGQDIVVLGDADGSYYSTNGWADSVYIDGFTAGEDKLVLAGNADQYMVSSTANGSWLLLGNDFRTAVAYLNGVTELDLTGSSLIYIETVNKGDSATMTPASSLAPDSVETALPKTTTANTSVPAITPAINSAIAANNIIQGTIGNDTLVGTSTNDQLLGIGGIDYLEGGAGADQFVLGDVNGSFYTQAGWNDSAYIEDFEVGIDQLVLHGSANDYTTESDGQGSLLYAGDDYIAYLKGITNLDLSAARYVS